MSMPRLRSGRYDCMVLQPVIFATLRYYFYFIEATLLIFIYMYVCKVNHRFV